MEQQNCTANIESSIGAVTISAEHYIELVRKAAALDIIIDDIRDTINNDSYYGAPVNDSVVMAATGMKSYLHEFKREKESDEA